MVVPSKRSKGILLGHQNSSFGGHIAWPSHFKPGSSIQGDEDPEAEVPQQRMVLFQRSSLLPEDLGAAGRSVYG